MDIVRLIGDSPRPMSRTGVAEALGLPRSTVYRIVDALLSEGMVALGEDRRLHLGPALWELSGDVCSRPAPLSVPDGQSPSRRPARTGIAAALCQVDALRAALEELCSVLSAEDLPQPTHSTLPADTPQAPSIGI